MRKPFAIYCMCNREPKSFQGGVIYDTLCNDAYSAARIMNTYPCFLNKNIQAGRYHIYV